MAKFTDLPNELILDIASHLDKSSDRLRLLLLNHRTNALKLPLLYKNIILHQSDILPSKHALECPLSRLASTLAKDNSLGRTIYSIRLPITTAECTSDHVLGPLLPYLSSLKSLEILTTGFHGVAYQPSRLAPALQSVNGTLESLTLCMGNSIQHLMGCSIGSLHDFPALKKLSIQSQILLGMEEYGGGNPTPMDQILPMGLERFTLQTL